MEEIYTLIEQKIKEAGYQKEVSGREIYDEINDEIDGKENGTYLFMCKKTDTVFFEYKIEVREEDFNLSSITIHEEGQKIYVDLDS